MKEIRAVILDQGGTLLYRIPQNDRGRSHYEKIMDIAGLSGDPMAFGVELGKRDKKYKKWSVDTQIEANEETIWSRWMLPDVDKSRLEGHFGELTLLFIHSKGIRIFRSDALSTISELHNRGYKLAVITNTVSKTLVPIELEEAGIAAYLDGIIMSSHTGSRKPDPAMFLDIAGTLGVTPCQCVYVGDAPDRDIGGARQAEYGMSILLQEDIIHEDKERVISTQPLPTDPDITITELRELLEFFKPLDKVSSL
jgi:putative hydrolase of the HAD superfamily